jgi:hypothetical protein
VSHNWAEVCEGGLKSRFGSKKIIGKGSNLLVKRLAVKGLYIDRLQVIDFIGDENTSAPAAYHLVTS